MQGTEIMTREDFKAKAERYRERAVELLATAEDFQDPENCKTMKLLAEEYMAMADRVERFDPSHDAGKTK